MSLKWKWPAAGAPSAAAPPTVQAPSGPPRSPGQPRDDTEPPQPLKTAMTANSSLRVLIACGIYDLICDYFGNEWSAANLEPELRRNVTAKRYRGGHAMYTDADSHLRFKADVAQFIRETLDAGNGR